MCGRAGAHSDGVISCQLSVDSGQWTVDSGQKDDSSQNCLRWRASFTAIFISPVSRIGAPFNLITVH
jgi:hypothetical protein